MPTAVDPVRRTLDTLALDPAAAHDRPYLESMLRRLGYSETEIRAALHGTPAPSAPPTNGRSNTAPADDGDRVIEIEYTGTGTKEFILVVGVDQSEMPDALGLGAGMDAGTEVFEGGPSMAEVDRLVAEGDLSDFDDWGDNALKEDAAGAKEGEGGEAGEGGEGKPDGEAPGSQELMEGTAATGKVGGDEVAPPGPAPIDFQTGEPLVEFTPTAMNTAVIEPIDPVAEADKLRLDGWAVADPVSDQFPAEGVSVETWEAQESMSEANPGTGTAGAAEGADAGTWQSAPHGFQYGDWVLYKRDELKGDQPQRVYFFSKGTPDGAEAAPLPDGYEVAENPETGRPYLRRAGSGPGAGSGGFGSGAPDIDPAHPSADPRSQPGAPKKRVRILRVRAATREEAIAKLQAEGRNVIASMPIDIEKKLR